MSVALKMLDRIPNLIECFHKHCQYSCQALFALAIERDVLTNVWLLLQWSAAICDRLCQAILCRCWETLLNGLCNSLSSELPTGLYSVADG